MLHMHPDIDPSTAKKRTPEATKRKANALTKILRRGKANALDLVQIKLVELVVEARLPLTFTEHPRLLEVLQAATQLAPNSYIGLGRFKQDRILEQMFSTFVTTVTDNFEKTRAMHIRSASADTEPLPFLCAMFDGWDSDCKSMFGVSCSW